VTVNSSAVLDTAGNATNFFQSSFTTGTITVSASPDGAAVPVGQTQQFAATVFNTSNSAVTWTINPAGVGSITSAGLYTAPASLPAQPTVTVTATSVADSTKTASAVITLYVPSTFTYRRALTIDHTKVSNTDQANFPVLVSGTYGFLATATNGGKVQNPNGYDILFSSDAAGANKLDHEIESYDPTTGKINFWVRIPDLSSTADTIIFLQYGSASVTSTQENRAGVWDGNFEGVWHLNGGTTLSAADSTANLHNGSIIGATATVGEIDGAANFSGSGQYIQIGNMGPMPVQGTISMWVKAPVLASYPNSFTTSFNGSGCGNDAIRFELNSAGDFGPATGNSSCAVNGPAFTTAFTPNLWHHVVVSWDSSTSSETGYYDGRLAQTITNTFWPVNFDDVVIGAGFNTSREWNGQVDEVRISSAIRSADWITTEYKNQTSPATFYSLGSESTDVVVLPGTVSLNQGQTQQFSAATVSGSSVSWSITPAGAGSITSTGLYTAPAAIAAPAAVTVTATNTTDSTKSGSATVNLMTPFSFNRAITIDHTRIANSDQANFPVLISGTYSYLATVANGGRVQNPNGYDIIFTSDAAGNNKLDHEIDSYNPATGAVNFWVRVPVLSHATDAVIYMQYGNIGISTSQENKTAVWDSHYGGVWHFSGQGSLSARDSSANANNGTINGAPIVISGQIGQAANFIGSGDNIGIQSIPLNNISYTISAWFHTPLQTTPSGYNTLTR
ncbi:MAG TPA: DUF2341 domain-containing protein, partial [Candidatus Angelobacter sp.]